MRIKRFFLVLLIAGLALNVYGQPEKEQEDNQEQTPSPEQSTGQEKNYQTTLKKNKSDKSKPFIPSEKVSPDIPVSFPADI